MRGVTAGIKLRHVAGGILAVAATFALASCATADTGPARSDPSPSSAGQFCPSGAVGPFGCVTFESHEGADISGTLSWLSSDPIAVSFTVQNGTPTMVVSTPCNAINVPVTITATQITPDTGGLSVGAMGCLSPAGDYEAWTTRFVSSPMDYALSGNELRLESANGIVQLTKISR